MAEDRDSCQNSAGETKLTEKQVILAQEIEETEEEEDKESIPHESEESEHAEQELSITQVSEHENKFEGEGSLVQNKEEQEVFLLRMSRNSFFAYFAYKVHRALDTSVGKWSV